MEKTIIKNKVEFNSFIRENTGYIPPFGIVKAWIEEPEKYPCIVVSKIEYDEGGPDRLEYKLVYLDDFEEKYI